MIHASETLNAQLSTLVVVPEYERRLRVLLEHARRNLPSVDEDLIRRAFQVAYWAHRDDRRASGEMYISHPLEVALIAARDIRADDVTVAAALLHDTVEDTDLSLDLIRSEFGDDIATITDGVTKIGSVVGGRGLKHDENVRKLMLSMASDVRVILVKFADRLHNMRTLGGLAREKQVRIAAETRDLYAPLAHRFGLHEVKTELEDLVAQVPRARRLPRHRRRPQRQAPPARALRRALHRARPQGARRGGLRLRDRRPAQEHLLDLAQDAQAGDRAGRRLRPLRHPHHPAERGQAGPRGLLARRTRS